MSYNHKYFKKFWNKINIFNGYIYPIIGSRSMFTGKNYEIVWSKKLGNWVGLFSWLPEIGLKVYIPDKNTDSIRRYKRKVIDKILEHPEMQIVIDHSDDFLIQTVLNKDGKYIGDVQWATKIYHLHDIQPGGDYGVCNIGFNPETQKWCGWSHRAFSCFGINDKLFETNYGNKYTYFNEHGTKTITNLEEAKQAAINFANYVS